jgi:mono/diheme cytochrome c family protein
MSRLLPFIAVICIALSLTAHAAPTPHVDAATPLDAGRYLVVVTGCNHCHTAGWQQTNGHVPETQWLKGGHAPPNVPTPNLRSVVGAMDEKQFDRLFRTVQPVMVMPWYNLRTLSDADIHALYTYIHSLKNT